MIRSLTAAFSARRERHHSPNTFVLKALVDPLTRHPHILDVLPSRVATPLMIGPNLTDADRQDRFIREAVIRISEALFRVANSADDLSELSLEVDLRGTELIHEGEERQNSQGPRKTG